nr:hypothetical protein [Tanacetum cinerariifolium]
PSLGVLKPADPSLVGVLELEDPSLAGPPLAELPLADPPLAEPPLADPPLTDPPLVLTPTLADPSLVVFLDGVALSVGVVRSEGGGDGSKYSAYSHRIRPIGFGPMPDIVQPKREQAEPEQAPPVIGRRESKRIKQIHFNKLPPPGPGLTLNDAMVLE